MEMNITENERGVRNLYFGHPFSKETYTNSVVLRTQEKYWEADFDGIYSGKIIEVEPKNEVELSDVETEHRVIRGTKAIFIGDYMKVLEMESDRSVYYDLKSKALIKVNNPNFLEFAVYTKKILKDPLKNIFDMKSVTPEQAKKYMDYAVEYDKDKQYSDKLIIKPYFASCDEGILILTEDFQDFNLDFMIDPENGVVGVKMWMTTNTSKYLDQYIDI